MVSVMDTTTKKRAAIYTRISKDHPANPEEAARRLREGTPRELEARARARQLKDCRALADRLGFTVDDRPHEEGGHHFDDNDISAFTGKRRDGYEAMLAAMKRGEFTAILCYHPDRLYRSLKDLERLIDMTDAANVQICSVNGGDFDLNTATGKMVARILGSVARQEVEHKGERQRSANTQRRVAGQWQAFGLVPFGYTKVGTERNYSLIPKEPEANLVRKAAAHVLAGGTLRSVVRDWNEQGFPTLRGGKWIALTVKQLLTNPVYAGLVGVPRTHPSRVGKRAHALRDIAAVGDWEPLYPEETWRALVTMLNDPARRKGGSYERRYMGSGVYRCGICGGVLYAGSSGKVRSYVCRDDNVVRGGPDSSHVTRTMAPVDDMVTDVALSLLIDPGVKARLVDRPGVDLDALHASRAALQLRLDELTKMFTAGEIDGSQLRSGSTDLRAQLNAADAMMASAVASSPAAALLDGDPDMPLIDRWNAAPPDIKGKVIDDLMTVVIHKAPYRGARFDPALIEITPKR